MPRLTGKDNAKQGKSLAKLPTGSTVNYNAKTYNPKHEKFMRSATRLMHTLFPFTRWLSRYPMRWLPNDLMAGITLGFIVLPQSIAFSLIAGVPMSYGIYAAIIPPIIAGLYGVSSHLVTGPTNASSIVILSVTAPLLASGGHGFEIVLMLAVMVGIIQIVLGAFRMGFMMDFISQSVVIGFTAGAGFLIGVKQLKYAFGAPIDDKGPFYETFINLGFAWQDFNPYTLALTGGTMLAIFMLDRITKKIPSPLIALSLAIAATYFFHLQDHGVITVGEFAANLPRFHIPPMSWELMQELVVPAFALALLGLMASTSITKSISIQSKQTLNNNKEIISQGMANIGSGFFGGMPVAGSFSLSTSAWKFNAKSSLVSVFMGFGMMMVIKGFAVVLPYLPLAAISGMLYMVIPRMVKWADIKLNILATRSDAATLIVTLLATLFLPLEFAIYVGVLLSVVLHLAKTSQPQITPSLPVKAGLRMQPDVDDTPCPQMGIIKLEGSLFFGSADYIKNYIHLYLNNHPHMQNLLLRIHGLEVLDASGVMILKEIHERLKVRGGSLAISGCSRIHLETLANAGLVHLIGSDYIRRSTFHAVNSLMDDFSRTRCHACPHKHFKECRALKKEGLQQLESDYHEQNDE